MVDDEPFSHGIAEVWTWRDHDGNPLMGWKCQCGFKPERPLDELRHEALREAHYRHVHRMRQLGKIPW